MNFEHKLFEDKLKIFLTRLKTAIDQSAMPSQLVDLKIILLHETYSLFVLARSMISSMDCLRPDRDCKNPERTHVWETNNWRGPRRS